VLAVVDDDPAVRHALSFAFETAGISVATFADAESALAAPWRQNWRCLILDQKLPRMTGLDLLARLRAAGVVAPGILITTHPSRETRTRALAAGVEIIEKPLLDDQLARKVRELMDRVPR
jgi:two-component system, LuxR family, response regulator FixJ